MTSSYLKYKGMISQEVYNPVLTAKNWADYFNWYEKRTGFKVPREVVDHFTRNPVFTVSYNGYSENDWYFAATPFAGKQGGYVRPLVEYIWGEITESTIDPLTISSRWKNANPGVIAPAPGTKGWLPIAMIDYGITLCIDLNPDKRGKLGQVIFAEYVEGYATTKLVTNYFRQVFI